MSTSTKAGQSNALPILEVRQITVVFRAHEARLVAGGDRNHADQHHEIRNGCDTELIDNGN